MTTGWAAGEIRDPTIDGGDGAPTHGHMGTGRQHVLYNVANTAVPALRVSARNMRRPCMQSRFSHISRCD